MSWIGFVFGLAILFGIPLVVLFPLLSKAASNRLSQKKINTFHLGDLLALIFLFQFPFLLVSRTAEENRHLGAEYNIILGFFSLVPLAIWYEGLRAVNFIGVTSTWKRIVAITLVFPVGMVSGILILISLSLTLSPGAGDSLWLLAGSMLLTIAVYLCSCWIARDSTVE